MGSRGDVDGYPVRRLAETHCRVGVGGIEPGARAAEVAAGVLVAEARKRGRDRQARRGGQARRAFFKRGDAGSEASLVSEASLASGRGDDARGEALDVRAVTLSNGYVPSCDCSGAAKLPGSNSTGGSIVECLNV